MVIGDISMCANDTDCTNINNIGNSEKKILIDTVRAVSIEGRRVGRDPMRSAVTGSRQRACFRRDADAHRDRK